MLPWRLAVDTVDAGKAGYVDEAGEACKPSTEVEEPVPRLVGALLEIEYRDPLAAEWPNGETEPLDELPEVENVYKPAAGLTTGEGGSEEEFPEVDKVESCVAGSAIGAEGLLEEPPELDKLDPLDARYPIGEEALLESIESTEESSAVELADARDVPFLDAVLVVDHTVSDPLAKLDRSNQTPKPIVPTTLLALLQLLDSPIFHIHNILLRIHI